MTITERSSTPETQAGAVDLYRDIHKGIRAELFSVTSEAGRVDPASTTALGRLTAHIDSVVETLDSHAEHEDSAIQPVLVSHLPGLFEKIATDHERLERRTSGLRAAADRALGASGHSRPGAVRELYLELADFTSIYLRHQDFEERVVQPALAEAIGPDAVLDLHVAIVSSIPPDQMARSLAFMLPAMNIDDRAQMLGGMRATAPAHIFEGVWGLAATVLDPPDQAALGARLGIS